MYDFVSELYPIQRSITGDGVRETLRRVGEKIALDVHEVPTGTQVADWTVPEEWNIREAYVVHRASGQRVIDVADHNLHLMGYSMPIECILPFSSLERQLHTLPDRPRAIPYRTSYYKKQWGFCLTHEQFERLDRNGLYHVVIDGELDNGHLTWAEAVLPGEQAETVLISVHSCHPRLANDNLSGIAVATYLARTLDHLAATVGDRPRYTYRVVYAPGTIGAITWLATQSNHARNVVHGLVVANLGDGGGFHYKNTFAGDTEIDRAVAQVLADRGLPHEIEPFVPFGYDERQYNSPGWRLPVGVFSRTPWGRYPEYHTSDDNLDLVRGEHLGTSLHRLLEIVRVLETNHRYRNTAPYGEPQLGRRGLYRAIGGGDDDARQTELALLWVLNMSDGKHDLLDIAKRSGMPYTTILKAARALLDADLLSAM
ncbi:MAG: DUF4910 domain-containing protein [Acidobacteriota bacterium]